MILHILDRCRLCEEFERVAVATCDKEIYRRVVNHGGDAIMTSNSHERATDRTEEALSILDTDLTDDDFVLMVQGDEILVSPEMTLQMIEAYQRSRNPVTNLVTPLTRKEDIEDFNTVKVVGNRDGKALYFSRAPIPSAARAKQIDVYQQTGIIGFSVGFLHEFALLEPTPLEAIESIDMLRVIEHGRHLQLVYSNVETIGVDTPQELKRAETVLRTDPTTLRYLDI